MRHGWQKQNSAALKITFAYVLLSAAWILFSDLLLASFVGDASALARWQTLKGLSFLVVTGLVLFVMVRRDVAASLTVSDALRESEERFRAQYKNLPLPTYSWRHDGDDFVLIDFNDAASEFTRGRIRELLGRRASEVHRERPDVFEDLARCHAEQRTIRREMQYRLASTGEEKLLDVSYAFVPPDLVMVHTEDIGERKAAEEALRRKQRDYEALVNSIDGIVWEFDVETRRFTFVSAQAERLLGYPVPRWLEDNFWPEHLHPEDREWATGFCNEATSNGRDHEFEYRMIAADRRTVWLRDIVTVLVEGERPVKLRGVMIDVTKRKQAEAARRHLQKRLAHVEEEERKRIAADLHDKMGDEFSRAKLQIERLKEAAVETPALREGVRQLEDLSRSLEQEVRHLVWELRPPALDRFGLASALENYVHEWSARYGVAAEFQSTGFAEGERLPPSVETALYRVAQEALTNVRRHAGATRAGVLLIRTRDHARLIVEDNGGGFDPDAARCAPEGTRKFGLLGMSERAELAGGSFGVESARDQGCTIFVSIPVPSAVGRKDSREKAAHLSG